MDKIAVIATHHKAGTVWINGTFRKIGEALDIHMLPPVAFSALSPPERRPPLITNATHSEEETGSGFLSRSDVRIFHLIRDPRDILISGMHYHIHAGEKWLLRPEPHFEGRTYREVLAACSTERERYIFEMRNSLAKTIAVMSRWDYGRTNGFECRYEDLIRDTEGSLFASVCEHLGFSKPEIGICQEIFWKNAIFGGKADRKRRSEIAHVRSGEVEQWRAVFDRKLGEAFLAQFGDVLIALGYEKDDAWLGGLPEHRTELDAQRG